MCRSLDRMRRTVVHLSDVQASLSRLLGEEPTIRTWAKTQLAYALRVAQDEAANLKTEVAKLQASATEGN